MKVPKSSDRRVQRTRKTLREALVALILERGWDDVTVLDVCERADVGRSTFYTHFADKEELLVSGFDDLKKAMRAVSLERSGDRLAFAHAMIEHAHENLRLFRALVGRRSAAVVQRRFRQLVHELIAEELEGRASEARLEAVVRYLTGAFVELLNWSLDPRGPKPAELEAHYQELSAAVLATLRPRRARRS